ncbi:MAG: hypothetical protein IJZ94_04305 [Clostridia bacterium]|nr:hypothetical protein [Clostridia bacterium]
MNLSKKTILLTAFKHTSADKLIKDILDFDTLFLPNDKILDSQKTIDYISKRKVDYIISIGQKPNIKDKVHIETLASKKTCNLYTSFDYENLKILFEKNGLMAKLSNNAGTSYCNELYFNGLSYIQNIKTMQMIFIHIPYVKNISDFTEFKKRFINTIHEL